MINCKVAAVVTDIEGTTTDIAFVHKTLFPYARKFIKTFVRDHAQDREVSAQLDEVARIANVDRSNLEALGHCLEDWIDQDQKITPLKALQGMIWKTGYESDAFRGHVYSDAHAQMQRWHAAGIPLYVYSSGSVAAQKLIYGHSDFGDLTPWFSDYFDTRIGGKRERDSYAHIAKSIACPAQHILFLSDVVEELDAAAQIGMQCVQLVRAPDMITSVHPTAPDFNAIHLERIA